MGYLEIELLIVGYIFGFGGFELGWIVFGIVMV